MDRVSEFSQELPPIIQTCGDQDFLIDDNLELKNLLETRSKDFKFHISQGNHDWDEWDNAIKIMIDECQLRSKER